MLLIQTKAANSLYCCTATVRHSGTGQAQCHGDERWLPVIVIIVNITNIDLWSQGEAGKNHIRAISIHNMQDRLENNWDKQTCQEAAHHSKAGGSYERAGRLKIQNQSFLEYVDHVECSVINQGSLIFMWLIRAARELIWEPDILAAGLFGSLCIHLNELPIATWTKTNWQSRWLFPVIFLKIGYTDFWWPEQS